MAARVFYHNDLFSMLLFDLLSAVSYSTTLSCSPKGEECSDKPIKRQNTEKVKALVKHGNEIHPAKVKKDTPMIAVLRTKLLKRT